MILRGGNSHQFVITNNTVLLNLEMADIKNNITVMDKQNDTLFSFVMPSFFEVHDMNNIEKEIKDQIINQLEMQVEWYDSNNRQEGILGYTASQLKAITSPITQDLTISDNKQIGTLTLRAQNGDKVEDVKVPLIWNIDQIEKNVVRKVIAKLPNGEEKLLKTQVVRYRRNIKWDKLLIGTPIEFTDWQVVPGTADYWKALVLTDKPYTPPEEEKEITDVVDINLPGYDYKDMSVVDENNNEDSTTVGGSQKIDPGSGNEYIYLHYTAKQYKANFKFVNDKSGWAYPAYQATEDVTYDNSIAIPANYANYESTLTQPVFTKDHMKVSYIEYNGKHYQPVEITKLKCPDHDVEFIYHLVPDTSVITYKDVTGLAEKDYDSKGIIITDSVMKNFDVNPNPQNGKWDDDKNGWNYQTANWTFINAVSPDKVNLMVYLKAKDKSINRVIKYVDGNGNEFLPDENTSMNVNHTLGDFESNLSPKYNGDLSVGNIFQIPSTKEKDKQTYYFDVTNSHFATSAEKEKTPIANSGITVDKLANTITVKVPKTVESGTIYTFVLPYVQSHINVIYKDVTGLSKDKYVSQAKGIDGHDKPIEYMGQPDMPFANKNSWDYEKDGWKLASSDEMQLFPGEEHNYSQDDVIYLKHGSEDVSRTVTEIIKYQLADGTKLLGLTYENAVTLNGTRDKVTGEVSYSNQILPAVIIPTKKGYTASVDGKRVSKIAKINVDIETADIVKTVIYTPNTQYAMVNYVDDTENKVIAQSPILIGVTDGTIKYSTAQTIKNLAVEGYVLVENSDETKTNPMIFDNDDTGYQLFRVHFVHKLTAQQGNVTRQRTIKYFDGETGESLENKAKTVTQDVKFKNTALYDEVDKRVVGYNTLGDTDEHNQLKIDTTDVNKSWLPDDMASYVEVISPDLTKYGYKQVPSFTLHEDNQDATKVDRLKADSTKDASEVDVYYFHDTEQVAEHAQAQEIIHYYYAGNKKKIHDDYTSPEINYSRRGTKDKVTKETSNWSNWTLDNSQAVFEDQKSPTIAGYKADQTSVPAPTVDIDKLANNGVEKIEITVTYAPNQQTAKLNFVDDTTGATLSKWDTATGESDDDPIIFSEGKTDLQYYLDQGYEFVSVTNDTAKVEYVGDYDKAAKNFGKFDHNDDEDQAFTVHLKHRTEAVKGFDTVTETVHYVYENGKQIANDVVKTANFERSGKLDHVTNETIWNNVAAQKFAAIDSPVIAGYKPDIVKIDAVTVKFGDDNINRTVIYQPNAQTAKIAYIDDTDSKTLGRENINGKFGDEIKFANDVNQQIKRYENIGYELVSNNFAGQRYDADDRNNSFAVHLKHTTTTVTPQKPGQPGQPVDPQKSDGPHYPSGTDLKQLSRLGTQTVHYVVSDGKVTAPADKMQNFTFTREITFDNVTGKIVKITSWNAPRHTFGKETTPVLAGYHADQPSAGGQTVAPDDLTKEVTVTYVPNGHIIPVDPDGNPIPDGPTLQYPSNPTDPSKVTPNKPVSSTPGDTPEISTVTLDKLGEKTKVTYVKISMPANKDNDIIPTKNVEAKSTTNTHEATTLPQTGNKQSRAGIIGLALVSVATMLGLGKKRKED